MPPLDLLFSPTFVPSLMRLAPSPWLRAVLAVAVLGCGMPALAEKADRSKPMVIEANKPGTVDLQRQVVTFGGDVMIQQGTMVIRAERVEIRETPDGFRSATATGVPGKPASFRQKREGVDETIEGQAERIEYDSRGDVVRFAGNAQVRRLRGTTPADEITGNLITYDNGNETFSVQGGAATPAVAGASAPAGGRVRVVISPRPEAAASAPK